MERREQADHRETIRAQGHPNVSATHASTLEVTTDDYLTPAGDCIVGINADRAPADFSPGFVGACRDPGTRITATLRVGDREQVVVGRGHQDLAFDSERAAVLRTSDHADGRTVLVGADAAAADLDRHLVATLAEGTGLVLELETG